jgi:hypothetical protein
MRRDRLKEVVEALSSLPERDVLVGIPEETTGRQASGTITNAQLGYIHEFGAPEANIPARAFLMPGIRNAKNKVAGYFRRAGVEALNGNAAGVTRALNSAGLAAAASAQRKITAGPFEPLKPATLAARRRRGRTGTRPLIDTAQLRRSLTYVVRPSGAAKKSRQVPR